MLQTLSGLALALEAYAFAEQAHQGQVRANKKSRLIDHARRVAVLIAEDGESAMLVAAALLHDIVEDTNVTLEDIGHTFGHRMRNLVAGLTDPPAWNDLPLLERKNKQALRLRETDDHDICVIKLADQTDNVESIVEDRPWSSEQCIEYCQGAMLVAEECFASSPTLAKRFRDSYDRALESLATFAAT